MNNPCFVVAASIALTACGGGGSPCAAKAKCPNDPSLTQAAIDACQKRVDDTICGSEFVSLASCIDDSTTCDATGHAEILDRSKCTAKTAAFVTCCTRNPDALACRE